MDIINGIKNDNRISLLYGVIEGDIIIKDNQLYRVQDSDCITDFTDNTGIYVKFDTAMMYVLESEEQNVRLIKLDQSIIEKLGAKKVKGYWSWEIGSNKSIEFSELFEVAYINKMTGLTYRTPTLLPGYFNSLQSAYKSKTGTNLEVNLDELKSVIKF